MASSSSTIRSALKTLIATEIGVGAKELSYAVDIDKNKLGESDKGYAIVANNPREVEGVTRHVTIDQQFTLVLTQSFPPNMKGDQSKLTAADTLYDRLETLYIAVINAKAGSPSIVIRVFDLEGGDVEYIDNIAVVRATLTIKYRQAL